MPVRAQRVSVEKQHQQQTQQHRQGEGEVDDRHVVQGKAVAAEGLENLGAVGGEAVNGHVGHPGDEHKPGGLALGDAFFVVQFGQQPAKHQGGNQAHQDGMGQTAVPGELFHRVEPRVDDDVEIGKGAKKEPPGHGLPAELLAQRDFAA